METAFRSEETFTQKQFWRWLAGLSPAEQTRHFELLNGRIVLSPPAKCRHAGIGATLTALLHKHVRASRLGMVFDASMGFDLPTGDTVQPDVAFVTTARLRATPPPKKGEKGFLRAVPSLVVEVLSYSTRKQDRTEKAGIYAKSGVDEYWIVDPDLRTVTVRILRGERYVEGPSVVRGPVRSRVLPKLRLTIDDVFADVDAVDA